MFDTFRQKGLLLAVLVLSSAYVAASVGTPGSDCYSLDQEGYLYDLTDLRGKEFHYSDQDGITYTVRLCKDVQVKTNQHTENLGRFSPAHSSPLGSKSFYQEYRHGDLRGCEEEGYDGSGRSSQVSISCGKCPAETSCSDPDGCICFVKSNPSRCLTNMNLGLKCKKRGPRVVTGFTVGFNPRGKEVVDNGITQWGYDDAYSDYSFSTRQSRVDLYLSAESTLAGKIGTPEFTVSPAKGLKVKLSGSVTNGEAPPTVLSPAVLEIDWQCEKKASTPYLVNVSISVREYDPILFTLSKQCDYEDDVERSGSSIWATFGVFIFVVIVMLTMFCCAGFLYKSRIEDKHGLDALPGYSAFTSFIESTNNRYAPANDATNITISHNGSSSSSGNHGARLPRSSDGPSYGAI